MEEVDLMNAPRIIFPTDLALKNYENRYFKSPDLESLSRRLQTTFTYISKYMIIRHTNQNSLLYHLRHISSFKMHQKTTS